LQIYRNNIFTIFLLVTIGLVPASAFAQSVSTPEVGITAEILEGRIQEVDASSALDETNKSALLDLYRKSLGLINQRQSYESRAVEFSEVRESAPKQAQILRGQLEQLEARPALTLPNTLAKKSLPQLEQQFLSEKAFLSGLRASLIEAGALLETQSLRAQQVRERLDQARQRQAKIAEEIKLSTTPGQSPRLAEAKLGALRLETRTLAAETEMLNQELLSQPMRIELYSVQRAKASREWDRR
jgi:potassium efflux system protein